MKRRPIVPFGRENLVERYRSAPGVLVGDTRHISGLVGRDESLAVVQDRGAQFEQAFLDVGKVLRAAGFVFSDVVELGTWVASFSMPGIVFEIKATAVRGA